MNVLVTTAIACSIFLILGASQNAEARSHFSFYLGGPSYVAPYYVAPPPQYYAPPTYYVAPRPQYYVVPQQQCYQYYDYYGRIYTQCY